MGHLVFILQLWALRFMDLTGCQPLALHWEPRREMKEPLPASTGTCGPLEGRALCTAARHAGSRESGLLALFGAQRGSQWELRPEENLGLGH